MRLGIIIQARMGSSRLPGKILRKLPENGGRTALEHVVRRCLMVKEAAEVIVATTTEEADLIVVNEAARLGVRSFRGSEDDVLERYYLAAKEAELDAVMRITSDCPCHDPEVLGDMVRKFTGSRADYVSNTVTRTYPHGLDAEVFTFAALERAYKETDNKQFREHVTPYLYRTGLFKTVQLIQEENTSGIRVTLDTPEDYALLTAVFEFLGDDFGLKELEELFEQKKWLSYITKPIVQKAVFADMAEEIEAAVRLLEKQDMHRAAAVLKREI
ncbi:acylneuraminate cytidylyltransferase [Geovibrio thiophilus]|uniref:Acylneuraminate cytidylyltransferase n=1 Tax=Geovibrio thiophilus TaxID=139438 RepID=A0A3R5V0J5_9BACT|nr:glycosyltransferase family protein [Geovibrio thiophilus]QAR34230.1 acylneuraminate cytidylyltransferase [Geovibrio thiophilus]